MSELDFAIFVHFVIGKSRIYHIYAGLLPAYCAEADLKQKLFLSSASLYIYHTDRTTPTPQIQLVSDCTLKREFVNSLAAQFGRESNNFWRTVNYRALIHRGHCDTARGPGIIKFLNKLWLDPSYFEPLACFIFIIWDFLIPSHSVDIHPVSYTHLTLPTIYSV